MEILYAKKARISKICINMEEETGEKTFLIQRVHCYTRRRAWISRTRWNSFFPIERGTRDDDRRRVKPDSSTGTGPTSTVHRVFSMKRTANASNCKCGQVWGQLSVDNSTSVRGKSIVEDAIPSSSLAILYTFSPTDRVLMEEGRIQSEYDNEKRRVVDCNGQL